MIRIIVDKRLKSVITHIDLLMDMHQLELPLVRDIKTGCVEYTDRPVLPDGFEHEEDFLYDLIKNQGIMCLNDAQIRRAVELRVFARLRAEEILRKDGVDVEGLGEEDNDREMGQDEWDMKNPDNW